MNVAVLMAQSNYQNLPKLDACRNDLNSLKNVIEKSGKYDKILILDDSVNVASNAKDKLVSYFETLKSEGKCDEVLLYFSGHGSFDDNEFFYVWDNYDSSKPRQTCLLNSEVDDFLKSLHAKITVKIVDACESGVPYLKGNGEFDKFLTSSKNSFESCYFMFSSQNDESSLTDSSMSYFTKSILCAINSFEINKEIRFSEIINYVSDEFDQTKKQKPFFVTQGSFVDKFIVLNNEMKKYLCEIFKINKFPNIATEDFSDVDGLFSLVQEDAKKYVEFENAKKCLVSLKEFLNEEKMNPVLENMFEKNVSEFNDTKLIPQYKKIAEWVEKKADSLYSRVNYKSVAYEEKVPKKKNQWASLMRMYTATNLLENEDDYKIITKYCRVVDCYENTIEMPFQGLNIIFKGLLPNLMNVSLCVVPILSRTSINIFYSLANYKRSGWDEQIMISDSVTWEYQEIPFVQENIKSLACELIKKINENVESNLRERFSSKK